MTDVGRYNVNAVKNNRNKQFINHWKVKEKERKYLLSGHPFLKIAGTIFWSTLSVPSSLFYDNDMVTLPMNSKNLN